MKKLSKADKRIIGNQSNSPVPIDDFFLLKYQDELTEEEINMVEQLEKLEALHEKRGNLIKELRKSIFGKMMKNREKAEKEGD